MPTLDDHDDRIRRLEAAMLQHDARIQLLEGLMTRVLALTDIVVQLLQRQTGDDAPNGH